MNFKIWIGVNSHGDPLIGVAFVREAEAKRALHDYAQIYPSQLRYRICVFLPENRDTDAIGLHFEGLAPSRSLVSRADRQWQKGRWQIMTRTAARELKESGARVLGIGLPSHEFPKADHARSIRVTS